MRWPGIGVLSLGLIGLLIFLTEGLEGSPISNRETEIHHILRKRNIWFSKKSSDFSRTADAQHTDQESKPCSMKRQAVECYVEKCVPNFIGCGRRASLDSTFVRCKLEHRVCASQCFRGTTFDLK